MDANTKPGYVCLIASLMFGGGFGVATNYIWPNFWANVKRKIKGLLWHS